MQKLIGTLLAVVAAGAFLPVAQGADIEADFNAAASAMAADVQHGLTTAWESWRGAASQNHIMFGDVSAWLMQYPGGIRLVESGFRKFLLAPDIAGIDWVKAAHESPYGTIRSEWRKEGGRFTWLVEVPPNTTARVILPDGLRDAVVPAGAQDEEPCQGNPSWLVGSGVWRWEAITDKGHCRANGIH